jgi:mannose-1-phosphate guanylyltransferase / mannose-6-phosphate isomerase
MNRNAPIVPVILAGGAGTRLWPVSREGMAKQFLPLLTDRSPYQETLLRVHDPAMFAPPIVLTNDAFRFFAKRQAAQVGIEPTIALEPARRDSGPAMLAAAILAQRHWGDDCLVLALAADHVIRGTELFRQACEIAATIAAKERIVTFGVKPFEPATRYGYIRPGMVTNPPGAFAVESFVEKPDVETAKRFVTEGYLWNSGNFLFPASLLIAEAECFESQMVVAVREAIERATEDLGFVRLESAAFSASSAKSIDYAVMQRTRRAAVVPAHFLWSDIGGWSSLRELIKPDQAGNAMQGPVVLIDSSDNYVCSHGPLVAGVGLEGLTVVATEDAVLITPTDRSHDVKPLVALLRAEGRPEACEHVQVHRPWGAYRIVCRGQRFAVKRIVVDPGARLSLQKHRHRAEHWVVVRGTAEVSLDGRSFELQENESMYIPRNGVHRLANPGRSPLELIEIQTGAYLGEDDIVRIEDDYRRA